MLELRRGEGEEEEGGSRWCGLCSGGGGRVAAERGDGDDG